MATLAHAMDATNRNEVQQAMDILSRRILAIQLAMRKGGSWEKAEAVELIHRVWPPAPCSRSGCKLPSGGMAAAGRVAVRKLSFLDVDATSGNVLG